MISIRAPIKGQIKKKVLEEVLNTYEREILSLAEGSSLTISTTVPEPGNALVVEIVDGDSIWFARRAGKEHKKVKESLGTISPLSRFVDRRSLSDIANIVLKKVGKIGGGEIEILSSYYGLQKGKEPWEEKGSPSYWKRKAFSLPSMLKQIDRASLTREAPLYWQL